MSTAREATIEAICAGFITNSEANKKLYRAIIEALWPSGEKLPGPLLTNTQLRAAVVGAYKEWSGKDQYQDVFRRVRELQGEEGLLGIVKEGLSYRMIHAEVSQKRVPRANISAANFLEISLRSGNKCAVCSKSESLVPDHKVPRSRLNEVAFTSILPDGVENLQALCQNCNIHKSVACRGCEENCSQCPWAFPESYPLITVNGELTKRLSVAAGRKGVSVQELAISILEKGIEGEIK